MANREQIPEEVKREIRQRCGFGCVICGHPIYEYEHMEEYAKVKRHVAAEMTLLCPNHHSEKTKGLMPSFIVKEANKKPYNLRRKHSNNYGLYYYGDNVDVLISDIGFTADKSDFIPILINDTPIILVKCEDEHYLLNINLYDKYDNLVLKIEDNNLIYSLGFWDIRFEGRTLYIRDDLYKVFIEIEFKTPNIFHIKRGIIYHNGYEIKISASKGISINNNKVLLNGFTIQSQFGIVIGNNKFGIKGLISN
jgi:trigger factor